MQAFFSSDGSYALQFLVIFLVILVLFLIAALLFMRLSGRGLSLTAGQSQRGRQPRLGIVDIYELDRQRQLILLRRDNVEHLLLVGGPNDVVIERHIQRGAGSRYAPEAASRSEIGSAEAGLMEPPRTDPFLDSPAPPTFSMPEVVPAAGPGTALAPDRLPSLDPGLFEPEIAPAEARPPSPVSRLMRRTAPPVVGPRAETASERAARPDPVPPPPAATESPPVVAGREPRAVDPAILSDMARQLQVALKRPSSAVTPPPGRPDDAPPPPPPSPPAPKPAESVAPVQPDPIATAMAAAPSAPPMPAVPPPKAAVPARQEPVPTPSWAEPAAPPKPAVPPGPEPAGADAPKSEPAKPEPAKPELRGPDLAKSGPGPKKAESAESNGQNPFSVEEIEAEFARLLGRPLDSKG